MHLADEGVRDHYASALAAGDAEARFLGVGSHAPGLLLDALQLGVRVIEDTEDALRLRVEVRELLHRLADEVPGHTRVDALPPCLASLRLHTVASLAAEPLHLPGHTLPVGDRRPQFAEVDFHELVVAHAVVRQPTLRRRFRVHSGCPGPRPVFRPHTTRHGAASTGQPLIGQHHSHTAPSPAPGDRGRFACPGNGQMPDQQPARPDTPPSTTPNRHRTPPKRRRSRPILRSDGISSPFLSDS